MRRLLRQILNRSRETATIKSAFRLKRWTWALLLAAQLLMLPLSVLDILFLRFLADQVIIRRRLDVLPLAVAGICLAVLLLMAAELWVQYGMIRLLQFWDGMFKDRFLRNILHKPAEFFRKLTTGEILYHVLNDSASLPRYMTEMRWGLIVNSVTVLIVVGLMLYLDVSLAVLTMSVIPVQLCAIRKIARKALQLYGDLKAADQSLLGDLNNIAAHIEPLRAFSMENAARRDWFGDYRHRLRIERKVLIYQRCIGPMVLRLSTLAGIMVIGYGGYRAAIGTLSVGTFMAFLLVSSRYLGPVQFLANYHIGVQEIIMCGRRVKATWMSLEPDLRPRDQLLAKPAPRRYRSLKTSQALRLSDVSYAYSPATWVLRECNWEIDGGRVYRLYGQNGSGKSTLLRVAAGLLTPQAGSVLLDDVDIRHVSPRQIRSQVMYVSSSHFWFRNTVKANLLYRARFGSDDARFEEAVRITKVGHILEQMDGRDATTMSLGAANFSAGERQKLALTRVLLFRPVFVFLDEAMTSIDGDDASSILHRMVGYLGVESTIVYVHHGTDYKIPGQVDVGIDGGKLHNCAV